MIFSERVNKLLNQDKYRSKTQNEIATEMGIAASVLTKIKGDNCKDPSSSTVIAIAKYFNVSADYLLGLSDITSTDVETQDICKKIGCAEEVLERLIRLYDLSKFVDEQPSEQLTKTVDLLNNFFLHPGIFEFLITIKKAADEKKKKGMYFSDKHMASEIRKAKKEQDFTKVFLLDKKNITEYDERIDAFSWRSQQCMSEIIKYLTTLDENTEKQISAYKANMAVIEQYARNIRRGIFHDDEPNLSGRDDPKNWEKLKEFNDEYMELIKNIWSVSVEDAAIKSGEMIHWLETVYRSIKGELNENAEE